jgi:Subtilase family
MRVIIAFLFCLLLVSCSTTSPLPQTELETESIVDPRDLLPWNKPSYFANLEANLDYYSGEVIAIYNQGSNVPNVDTAASELTTALLNYLRDVGRPTDALRLKDLNGQGDAVYGVAPTTSPVAVGTTPVCGELIAQFVFTGMTLEEAIIALNDLNNPTRPYLPQGNSLYGASPRGKAAIGGKSTSSLISTNLDIQSSLYGSSLTPAFTSGQWAYSAINAVPSATAKGIKVAVLDTGVTRVGSLILRNPANFVSLIANSNEPRTTITDVKDDYDDPLTPGPDGHGTGIAALIADNTYGVALGATIVPVKVCDDQGVCDDITVTRGMCYAQSKGADVLNVSLGTLINSPMVRQAIREVNARGSLVVAAAGNTNFFSGKRNNQPDHPAYWANLRGLLSVGAIDQGLAYGDFATANRFVELVAPGADSTLGDLPAQIDGIETYDANGNQAFFEGTSYAAPFVTATAAALYYQCPNLKRNNIVGPRWLDDTLKATATPWASISQDPFRDLVTQFGSGKPKLLDVGSALSTPCP